MLDILQPTPSLSEALAPAAAEPADGTDYSALGLIPVASEVELRKVDELLKYMIEYMIAPLCDAPEHVHLDKDARELFAAESLLRFVRARPTVAASTKMLLDSLAWRRSYDFHGNLAAWYSDTSSEAEYLRTTWPCGCHGTDKRGVPVYYARYGLADMNAAVQTAGFDRFLRFSLSQSHEGWVGTDKASLAAGKHLVT